MWAKEEKKEGRKEKSGELEVVSSEVSDSTETELATVGQCGSSLVFGRMNYSHIFKMDSLCLGEFHEMGEIGASKRNFQRKMSNVREMQRTIKCCLYFQKRSSLLLGLWARLHLPSPQQLQTSNKLELQ